MRKMRIFSSKIVMVLLFSVLVTVQCFAAAVTNTFFDQQLSITDSSGTGSGDTSKYTITVSARSSATTNTITIKNEGTQDATLSFSYSVSNQTAFTINDVSASATGNYSSVLTAGSNLVIKLTTKGGLLSKKTATLTLTDIAYTPMAATSNITFEFDSSLGSVTANETALSDGEILTVDTAGATITATPATGASFLAWADTDGKIISRELTYTQFSVGDKTVRALFSKDTPYFMVDNVYMVSDLNAAVAKGTNIVLMCNATLPAGDYVIPSGVTLLIPFDDANTIYTTTPGCVNEYKTPSVYRTLKMASGANIAVNGAICVPAKQSAKMATNGSPTGSYGLINMAEGSTITVNSGANLYAWGYITGAGKITAKSGATIYEDFQEVDWRGGNATTDMIDNSYRVFPMSQYYVQNIEVPLTLEAGAIENGYMSVYVTIAGIQGSNIPFIGPSGMFRVESGSITKDYDEKTDRLVINVDGTLNMASLSISMKLSLIGTQTVNSSNYTLPINSNITLHINSGSNVNITQDMALLPGGVINVYKDAKCIFTSGAKAFIYGSEDWGGYCSQYQKKFMPLKYAPGRLYNRTEADLVDAEVYIEGEIDAQAGFVYSTTSGANIHGADGALIKITPDTATTVTYQAVQTDTTISYNEIAVTTAQPRNDDGTYIDPEALASCCSEYICSGGNWVPYNANHTNVVTTDGTQPTCDEAGVSESSYCSACNTVIKAQETIPATGHSFDGFACADCGTKKVLTETECSVSGENLIINSSFISDVASSAKVTVIAYNSFGKMIGVFLTDADLLDEITMPSEDVAIVKICVWDGFNSMSPISLAEEVLIDAQ